MLFKVSPFINARECISSVLYPWESLTAETTLMVANLAPEQADLPLSYLGPTCWRKLLLVFGLEYSIFVVRIVLPSEEKSATKSRNLM